MPDFRLANLLRSTPTALAFLNSTSCAAVSGAGLPAENVY
jgi:hypothetical protein